MKSVEMFRLENDGTQKKVVTCKLISEAVVCEGDEVLITNLEKEGINDYSQKPPQKVFPKDGLVFLENLQRNFTSGYLNATEVKEATKE